jgi:hypothetical protein
VDYNNGGPDSWFPWSGGINPVSTPMQFELFEEGLTGTIYTNTILFPAGTPLAFHYKYGMDIGSQDSATDDEANFPLDHMRVLRSTANNTAENPYVLPTDTFGYMYYEPYFTSGDLGGANLSVGNGSRHTVAVTWLGLPGVQLQVRTNLTKGAWIDLPATDGTNWTTGYPSTNGFVSQTNWSASGTAFFRLSGH